MTTGLDEALVAASAREVSGIRYPVFQRTCRGAVHTLVYPRRVRVIRVVDLGIRRFKMRSLIVKYF